MPILCGAIFAKDKLPINCFSTINSYFWQIYKVIEWKWKWQWNGKKEAQNIIIRKKICKWKLPNKGNLMAYQLWCGKICIFVLYYFLKSALWLPWTSNVIAITHLSNAEVSEKIFSVSRKNQNYENYAY